MNSMNENLKLYIEEAESPDLAHFLENPRYKRSFLDFIAKYNTRRKAELASIRKFRNFGGREFAKEVNWKILFVQAKARQKALENSTKVLTEAMGEAASMLEELFDTQSPHQNK